MLIWSMRYTLMWNGDLGYVDMLTCCGSRGGRDHPSLGGRREGRHGQHWRGSAEVKSELVYTFSLVAYCDMIHVHCFPYYKWSGLKEGAACAQASADQLSQVAPFSFSTTSIWYFVLDGASTWNHQSTDLHISFVPEVHAHDPPQNVTQKCSISENILRRVQGSLCGSVLE